MNKKLFKRAAAFAVALLMALGVTAALPEGSFLKIAIPASAVGDVAIDETNFPDEKFRTYVSTNFDTDGNDILSSSEISKVTAIDVYNINKDIQSLKGIEFFIALTELDCHHNQLTSLDISKNTKLAHLDCSNTQLTSLDVSKNTELVILDCSANRLTSLDVSQNTALTELNCHENQLISLDVSQNTALKILCCYNNHYIKTLDVSKNTALTDLCCWGNQFATLDVSKNTVLKNLQCEVNQLTSLDVSKNTALTILECNNNQFNIGETCGTYDLANLPAGFDVTKSLNWRGATLKDDKLTEIYGSGTITYDYDCGNNHTATFSLVYDYAEHSYDNGVITVEPTEQTEGEKTYTCTNCGATQTEVIAKLEQAGGIEINSINFPDDIFRQYVSDNFDNDSDSLLSNEEIKRITEINVQYNGMIHNLKGIEYFTALRELICIDNQLTSLDISKNTELTTLWCDKNQLASLDVSKNTALTFLRCDENQLTSLDVNNNTALTDLRCGSNKLTSIDVSNNTMLTDFACDRNQLKSLDISNNTALTFLWCGNNQLTSLDLSNNIMLTDLGCFQNQLTSLDLSNNTALKSLDCGTNQFKSLDLSNNTALISLDCNYNQLTSLSVDNNIALISLWCYGNQLTSLDLSNNSALTSLLCYENQLKSLDVSNNIVLTELRCGNNRLTSLDLNNNTALTQFEGDRNYYNIGETCGAYDLKNLPADFDITKASNWQGATLEDGNLTGINGTVSYDYDCGNNHTATFNLTYTSVEHSYDDGVVTIEPTEQTEGEKTYTCTICGATKTKVIEKLEHIHNKGDELMSDKTGHWYTCDGCDEKLDFATHTEDGGTVTVEPTETTEGQKVYECTICGRTTRTDVIAKLEHVHNRGTELVSDKTGHWYICSDCGEKLDFATHTEDGGTVTVEPTETTEGQKVYKCTVCGYTTRTETIAKLEDGSNNPTVPSRPSQPSEPSNPTQPSNPPQPETNESETNISVKKGWGNVVKEINKANDNSKINVDMGNSTNVPKNVMNAIKGKNVDIVLDMGDGITWTINGQDVTNPQSINFSVTKKKNSIPEDMISDPSNTIPLVLAHNGSFGCSATLSIDLKGNDKKTANLYYYNTKTKELEFVDSSEIVNGKANLVFTHASDWAIVISDTSAEYEDVSSAAGAYETDDNSHAPLCMIMVIIATVGFLSIIIAKRLAKNKH